MYHHSQVSIFKTVDVITPENIEKVSLALIVE